MLNFNEFKNYVTSAVEYDEIWSILRHFFYYIQDVLKMPHNIYITSFYDEIEAKNSSTNLLLTLRSWSYSY
jgi:hypothetical protein